MDHINDLRFLLVDFSADVGLSDLTGCATNVGVSGVVLLLSVTLNNLVLRGSGDILSLLLRGSGDILSLLVRGSRDILSLLVRGSTDIGCGGKVEFLWGCGFSRCGVS